MPVDPKGTTPGLNPGSKPVEGTVNMKCRNPKCKSITSTEIRLPNKSQRVYRCTKCGYTWTINVGGFLDI